MIIISEKINDLTEKGQNYLGSGMKRKKYKKKKKGGKIAKKRKNKYVKRFK